LRANKKKSVGGRAAVIHRMSVKWANVTSGTGGKLSTVAMFPSKVPKIGIAHSTFANISSHVIKRT